MKGVERIYGMVVERYEGTSCGASDGSIPGGGRVEEGR